jgi:hypothetical protein
MNGQTKRKFSRTIFSAALCFATLNIPIATAAGGMMTETIFEKPIQYDDDISAHFNVNRDLGRAWVEVQLTPPIEGDGVPEPEVIKEAVNGLYYDRDTKQVIYQKGPTRTVCAEDSTFLWTTGLKETGQCPLRASSQTRKVDDGFDLEDTLIGKVVLEVPASGGTAVSSRADGQK